MARKDKISADQVRENAQGAAQEASKLAKTLADQGKGWATPKVEAVFDWAGPRMEQVWNRGVEATAPRVVDAADKSRDAIDVAHDRLVDDVIPRIIKAMEDAAGAAKSSSDSAHARAIAALAAAEKAAKKQQAATKSHKAAKTFGWVLVGTAVAGAGVLIWRRTQPVDDPWAEEYWDDATVTTNPSTPSVVDKAKHAASDVASSVSDAASKAKDAATDAVGKAKDAASDAVDKAKHTADDTKDKVEDAVDDAKKD